MNNLYHFPITTMGVRVLVSVIIVQLCLLNSRQILAWSVVGLASRLTSGEIALSDPVPVSARHLRGNGAELNNINLDKGKHAFNQTQSFYKQRSNDNWTELVLTIQWPQSFCMEYNDSKKGGCKVPSGVNDWTLHGLWPSSPRGMGPSFCNNTWKFDVTKIADIEGQMNASWPNCLINEAYDSLWSHEWDKHGTCASSLPALYGEHNYFLKTLNLRKQYDVKGMLAARSIVPSTTNSYDYPTILDAVTSVVGMHPTLTCVYDQNTHRVYLSQVEFCLDKQFGLIDCVPSNSLRKSNLRDEDCAHDKMIFYPPVTN